MATTGGLDTAVRTSVGIVMYGRPPVLQGENCESDPISLDTELA